MRKSSKNIKIRIKQLIAIACIGIATAVSLYIAVLHIFPFPHQAIEEIGYSKIIFDKDGNLLRAFLGKDDLWLLPVKLKDINPNFINATIAIEDKRFRYHHGVDVIALLRAIKQNITNRKIISGASTISMQVIRILEKRPRTLQSKIIETVHAIHLESLYSKDDILKLYFEIAPYGGNIQGVKAASLRYFQKYPSDLTLSECALLAGLPQSPSLFRPNRYPDRAKKRRNSVLLSMLKNRYITEAQYNKTIAEPVIAGSYSSPFKAPHFTRFVKNRSSDQKSAIITSLASDIQHFAELALKEKVEELKPQGVRNGAVVVIENETGKIRAMVGSNDFFSEYDSGQINGATSSRSPGSALKPFTYLLAFDEGIYTPKMILADVPVQYNGYSPLDYDKRYRGPVTVKDALVDSLNIPAVEVLDKIGYRKLYLFLQDIGISTFTKPPQHYGLSLTLGSGDVNLLELTNAYAMLARLGVYKPYTFLEKNAFKTEPAKRVVSEGAAYLIADILSDTRRLEATGFYRDEKSHPRFAFKTGTSCGHRDAWTFLYNPEYTIGVWLGNFSAKTSKALVGIDAATPLAVKIFDSLYTQKTALWFKMPDSIGERYVCALSGEPVGENCPHSVRDLYIKGQSRQSVCKIHKKIAIDTETGLALDDYSRKGRKYTEQVFEIWPDSLQSWIKTNVADYTPVPEYLNLPKKIVNFDKNKPKIISPSPGCEYFIQNIANNKQKLTLMAHGSFDTDKLYWFINGKFYNQCNTGERVFWSMDKGKHKITCTDKYGRSSSVTIVVR